MTNRFWIIGGQYTSTQFDTLIEGSQTLIGPFAERAQAMSEWKRLAGESRSDCHTRFAIAEEPLRA